MARIRSIHPGMMTDEDYMALSFAARICLAGVWMEADDHGVFEWKPLTLKARIFPADNVDMAALLAELQTHSWIKQFPHEGKTFGVCKNFRKWQRPKKPHYAHPFPDEFVEYTGLKQVGSEPVPHQFPTASPIPPQMEDVGCRKEEESTSAHAALDDQHEAEAVKAYNDVAAELGWPKCSKINASRKTKLRARLRDSGGLDGWYAALARAKASKFLRGETGRAGAHANWRPDIDFFLTESKFLKLIEGGFDGSTAAPAVTTNPTKALTDDDWRSALRRFKADHKWPGVGYGPQPGYGGCVVPTSILAEFNLEIRAA